MSSITIQPILYELKYDNKNNKYIDNLYFSIPKEGLKCPCREKSKTVFFTKSSFKNHIKTKSHQKWIININETSENNEVYKYKYEELKKLLREKDILLNQIDIKNQQLQQQICNLSTILSEKQSKIIELERKNINPDNLTSSNIKRYTTYKDASMELTGNMKLEQEEWNVESIDLMKEFHKHFTITQETTDKITYDNLKDWLKDNKYPFTISKLNKELQKYSSVNKLNILKNRKKCYWRGISYKSNEDDELINKKLTTTETIHPHSQFNSFNLPMLREINNVERSFETDNHEQSTNYDYYDSIYDVN